MLAGVAEEQVTSVDRAGDTTTVALHGEVDVATVDQVRIALADAVADRPGQIVVDLSGVERMDTVGAWIIYRTVRDRGAKVVGANAEATSLLDQVAGVGA